MGEGKRKARADAGGEGPRFEEALAALEAAVADLERGDLGIDAALARYEAGIGHLRRCQEVLKRAEQRVELLLAGAEGQAKTAPFPEPEGSAAP